MRVSLGVVAGLFLRLGTIAFGGPAAHIAMMHAEVVRRRRWVTDTEFADLIAATNLIPGPNSTEMAIHIGRRSAGWPGLLTAGVCFIVPAALIVTALAALYVRYGTTPDAQAVLVGISPIVLAIIGQAVWALSRSTLRTPAAWIIAAAAVGVSLAGVHELLILLAAGIGMAIGGSIWSPRALVPLAVLSAAGVLAAQTAASDAVRGSIGQLVLFFLKVGSVLYGSGYVLIAFLRADLVERWHWLTDRQLLDAIAIGQVTPGPLFTTATFIGYVLHGWPGAALATIAIFLPGFVFVALSSPLLPRIRESKAAGRFLDGVVAASLGLMVAVAITLAAQTLSDMLATASAVIAVIVLVRWNVNSVWLIAAGAAIGFIRSLV